MKYLCLPLLNVDLTTAVAGISNTTQSPLIFSFGRSPSISPPEPLKFPSVSGRRSANAMSAIATFVRGFARRGTLVSPSCVGACSFSIVGVEGGKIF